MPYFQLIVCPSPGPQTSGLDLNSCPSSPGLPTPGEDHVAAGHTGRGTEMENKDHALCAAMGAQIRGPPKAGETETSASGPTLGIRTVPGWAVDGERGGGMRRHRPALWGWSGPPCMGEGHGGSLRGGRSHRAGWARLWGGAQTGTSRDPAWWGWEAPCRVASVPSPSFPSRAWTWPGGRVGSVLSSVIT